MTEETEMHIEYIVDGDDRMIFRMDNVNEVVLEAMKLHPRVTVTSKTVTTSETTVYTS